MSAFAAIVSWEDPRTPSATAEALGRQLAPWSAGRIEVAASPGAAFGISLLAADERRRQDRQPLVDEQRKVALVADCRLDEERTLRAELGQAADATDAAVLMAGYLRWGADLPRHLLGDFSGAIWDWGNRRCVAFCDPLGVKPLFYARLPGGIAIASDVELILPSLGPNPAPDDQMVIEYLLWEYASTQRTFWAAVSRLPGGHCLVQQSSDSRGPERYWRPTPAPQIRSGEELREQFREVFFRSVESRLGSDGPVLAHLSGGVDSSLIVCAAAQISATRGAGARVETVSERFPGAAWDEAPYIQEVVSKTGLSALEWDGSTAEFLDLSEPSIVGPGTRASRTSGSVGDIELAVQRKAHVMLSGEGGDQLGRPAGLTVDLLKRSPLKFGRETFIRSDLAADQRLARVRLALRQVVPISVRRGVATFRYKRRLPPWLEARWRAAADDIVASFYPSGYELSFEHNIQRARWHELTAGRMSYALSSQQQIGARQGVEFRFPFLDRELVELVLSIPPEHWPLESPGARLHRELVGDILPPVIRERRNKAIFSGAIGERLKRAARQIGTLLNDGPWLSGRYVRRQEARLLFEKTLRGDDPQELWSAWHWVRAIATLEAWLRRSLGYAPAAGEVGRD